MYYTHHYDSPLGEMLLASDGTVLTGVWFVGQRFFARQLAEATCAVQRPIFEEACRWLDRYFEGVDPGAAPALRLEGNPFQLSVWSLLQRIPYGQTTTYGALARELERRGGDQKVSARAVGGAVGRNPVSLMVACHRVVGSSGRLTGYAAGIDRKRALLHLERFGLLEVEEGTIQHCK